VTAAEPPPEPSVPALRVSDAEREQVADRLRTAAGEGRLTVDELDERLQLAYAARTGADLEPLLADLPAEDAPSAAPRPSSRLSVRPGEGGARWLVAIMGGCERRGRWRVARQSTVVNVMGGSDLDFNEAELAGDVVEMTVVSLMGGSEIHVPDGLNVELSEFALMGGNDVKLGNPMPSSRGPVLRLRLVSIMGGTELRRGPKLSRKERKRLKQHGHGWH
jgi:Domain of unknown function (DUF1707)